MEITEVRVKLTGPNKNRLQAFCSITIDNDFVVRDLKIIEGQNGAFVAMPSRKLADRCPKCRGKNHLRAQYCNDCGARLAEKRFLVSGAKVRLYADTAHPINTKCRELIQHKVLTAFKEELEKSTQPGYKPPKMEYLEDIEYYESEYPEENREGRLGEGLLP
ncbi:MAG: SpoVG family protein [Candidatus Brocadiaceae bacterium]|nr:SpoVG family protein [Candidatus Brocadiaceae bacterium]